MRRGLAWVLLLLACVIDSRSAGHAQDRPDTEPHASAAYTLPAPDLTPGPDGKLSAEQMQQLFQIVAEKDLANQKQVRDYTYIARQVQNKLDGKGQTKSTEVKTYEVLEIYGEQVQRLIAKDDKPLEGKDAAKEEESQFANIHTNLREKIFISRRYKKIRYKSILFVLSIGSLSKDQIE